MLKRAFLEIARATCNAPFVSRSDLADARMKFRNTSESTKIEIEIVSMNCSGRRSPACSGSGMKPRCMTRHSSPMARSW